LKSFKKSKDTDDMELDETWDPKDRRSRDEVVSTRSSRRTRGSVIDSDIRVPRYQDDDNNDALFEYPRRNDTVIDADRELPKAAKKRGRKKKETVDANANLLRSSMTANDESRAITSQPKRKRGRPRKAETDKADTIDIITTEDLTAANRAEDPNAPVSTTQPIKISRSELEGILPTKMNLPESPESKDLDHEVAGDVATESKHDLMCDKDTVASGQVRASVKAKDDIAEVGQENKEPRAFKDSQSQISGKEGMQNGKVAFRVGLSKRSRLPPLLKSIRK
jgi:hypothetical protein